MTGTHLETAHLLLRPFTADDAPLLHQAVYGNAAVMRYLPGGVPRTLEQTQQVIEFFTNHYQQHGFGAWVLVHQADGQFIGQCGLNRLPDDGEVEVFYAIAEPYWGQGLTTEAAEAVLGYGFERAALERIIALAVPENIASRRVMEKLGMRYEGVTTAYYRGAGLALYTLTREQWQVRHPLSG